MDFSENLRKPRAESIVPMINVVFLLLIFFLMTSNLAQPEPFEINPPNASLDAEPEVDRILYIDETGRTSFDGVEGEAALAALAAISEAEQVIQLRADAELEAKKMAELLRELAEAGLSRVELVVASQ